MNTIIRGEKIDVTQSMKDYVLDKLHRLDRYFDNPDEIKCNVKIRVKNLENTIEVTVPTSRFTLRAEQSNEDFYAATDLVLDKLERQITKNKSKIKNRYKQSKSFEMNLDFEAPVDDDEGNEIVKRKKLVMKPMSEEEAVLQLKLLDHDFFVFENTDEKCISVIYARKDGKFGIINTK